MVLEMALTDTAIKNAKPLSKQYRLTDGLGLYLLVRPNGSKLWRQDYRFAGKDKTLSVGIYPDVSLKLARERRDEIRRQVAQEVDPSEYRKSTKLIQESLLENSFEAITREWYLKNKVQWSDNHAARVISRFEREIFPWIGAKQINVITAPELLATIRKIEERGQIETAHRVLQGCGQVFRYAIATARADRNVASDLKGALPPVREKHFAAIIDPKGVASLLRNIDNFSGTFVVKIALQLAPFVFVRPGELRHARWEDIDIAAGEWKYKVSKTKTDHLVPLARQSIVLLEALYPLTGRSGWVFPGVRKRDKPISEVTINAALQRMGYDTKTEMTGHGFRAMARTLLHEQLHFDPHIIEHQLAHQVPDALGTAYNRTKFIKERKEMMQAWADYLDQLKAPD